MKSIRRLTRNPGSDVLPDRKARELPTRARAEGGSRWGFKVASAQRLIHGQGANRSGLGRWTELSPHANDQTSLSDFRRNACFHRRSRPPTPAADPTRCRQATDISVFTFEIATFLSWPVPPIGFIPGQKYSRRCGESGILRARSDRRLTSAGAERDVVGRAGLRPDLLQPPTLRSASNRLFWSSN